MKKREESFLERIREELEMDTINWINAGRYERSSVFDETKLVPEGLFFKTQLFRAFSDIIVKIHDKTIENSELRKMLDSINEHPAYNYLIENLEESDILTHIWLDANPIGIVNFEIFNHYKFIKLVLDMIKTDTLDKQEKRTIHLWGGAGYLTKSLTIYSEEVYDIEDTEELLYVVAEKIIKEKTDAGFLVTEKSDPELHEELMENEDEQYIKLDMSFNDEGIVFLLIENMKID